MIIIWKHMMSEKKQIQIKPVKPNKTEALDYYTTLEKEIKKMNNEVINLTKADYKKTNNILQGNDSKIRVNDFSVVLSFSKSINKIMDKYLKKFSYLSSVLSPSYINKISKYTTKKLDNNIESKIGKVKVNEDTVQLMEMKQLQINENVQLIKSIPQKYFDKVNFSINEALLKGRDLNYLTNQLQECGDITRKRAKNISIDQLNKATNLINNERLKQYGITKAKWQHSGASKQPRPDHVAATGKVYDINDGCKISGKYIQPGQLVNCKCISVPIIEI